MATKLIVQVPCFNEAETLPSVLENIPRRIEGVDVIETLVIDDGSTDGTADIARKLGVTHVVRNARNLGLARSFQKGLNAALAAGADIIVNTDGDNQYDSGSIPDLIQPILEGQADVVVGDRRTSESTEFSATKRFLQKSGSAAIRWLSGLDVADAVSGFRAYSRNAALRTQVHTKFSYTTETLIAAGQSGMFVASVPVATNPKTRESRLAPSMGSFLRKQIVTILRSYTMYRPLRVFAAIGAVMGLIGIVPILRFLYFYLIGEGGGHIQSLVLGAMFFITGYLTLIIALLADTIATNRQLLEATLERVRRMELRRDGDEGDS